MLNPKLLILAGLVSLSAWSAGASGRAGDELLVVDCLLPPQVRQLGQRTTYLSARRPVRTTGRECEIRGGEYVAFDRASLKSSLEVWLPGAEDGDPRAQTIVGEIYEKGIGGRPDYASAARWYRTAAAHGDIRAQISLGYLLENGLGTERDPEQAASWYRSAAGFDAPGELDPEIFRLDEVETPEDSPELIALRDEVHALSATTEQMRAQLETTRESLEATRAQLEATEAELKQVEERETEPVPEERVVVQIAVQAPIGVSSSLLALRNDLDQRQREIDELTALLAATRAELSARTTKLGETEARVAAQSEALAVAAAERDQLQELEQNLAAREAEIEQQRREVAALEQAVANNSSTAAASDAELATLRAALADSEAAAAARRDEIERLETRLEQSKRQATAQTGDLTLLEAALIQREAELAAERESAARLQTELSRVETDARRMQADIAQQRAAQAIRERVLVGPTIAMIEPEFAGLRGLTVVSSEQGTIVSVAPDARTRQIIGRVTAPAGLLALTVNETNIAPNPAGVFSTDVALDRLPKPVSVVAVDQQGKRADVAFEIRPIAAAEPAAADSSYAQKLRSVEFGKYYALVIGNNAYQGLPDLETAVNDARDLERVLKNSYGFQTRLLENASRYEILSALNELREQLTSDDNLLIFYAGHGELDKTNMRGHWLPVDAELDNTANWLSNVAITDILNVMNARQILVIADSCYSGALTRSSIAQLAAGMTEAERLNWLETMVQKRSRMVMSSGGLSPVLDAGGGANSVFMKALLEVLEGNRDLIEGQRLYKEVAARVAYQAASMQFDQVPEYAPIRFAGHESGDFFFVPEF
jgi:hypothetical protein